jgi:hypothetical protein
MRSSKSTTESSSHVGNGLDPTAAGIDADIESLWTDDGLNDPLTVENFNRVLVGKPRNFYRTAPDKAYRRKCVILVIKSENSVGEEYFLVGDKMRGKIDEARPCTLVTVVDRVGYPRLWPLIEPRDGENDNDAWVSARAGARVGLARWTKLLWRARAYYTRDAEDGYAPDPDWSKLPPFADLIKSAFGEHGIINDESHPVYRALVGKPPTSAPADLDADPLC